MQGLAEARRLEGTVSHGKDAYKPMMEYVQARFVAQAADAIAYFLYGAHKAYSGIPYTRIDVKHEDNPDFNEYLDNMYEDVQIKDGIYTASEVLFYTDNRAYLDLLSLFRNEASLNDET